VKRKVTVIGGGTGSFSLLQGLRHFEQLELRSIVTMMDSGGDSGRLRDEFGVLPPGDIRRCLVALSEEGPLMRELFSFRFSDPPLEGRHFGNLFFLALTKILGTEKEAIEAIGRILKIRGQVIPITLESVHLHAELSDGQVLVGEANIDVPKHDARIPVARVYLSPEPQPNPDALAAIADSDVIVFAPGDLYTSTIANLVVPGVPEAIRGSRAHLVYVLNLMTKYGETNGYAASAHVAELARYARRVPDAVLVHAGAFPSELLARYRAEHAHQVRVDTDELRALGVPVVHAADIASSPSLVRHDPTRTAAALLRLFDALPARE
jgi:uncharacterized cofD-like protein